ncbi:MAG: aldo/keto reductase [Thermodesulfobacteriota bacterium]
MWMKPLGRSGIEISAIIMGTWQAGKTMWTGIEDGEIDRAIRAAYDAGITTFDTATVYGNGHSERMLGKALHDVRDRVVIATKVFAHSLAYDKVFQACHKSLKDLDTDYIDLYQIHWPAGAFGSKKVPVEETLSALGKLKEEGKIRAIGVSNFSRAQLESASQYARIDSLQPPYSLFWRQVETDAMPYCLEKEISVLAYSPMAQGILTDKFGADPAFEKGDHRAKNKLFQPENYERVQAALKQLRPIAESKGITTGQLALAWIISRPSTCAIAGARNSEQAVQNAEAGDIILTESELSEMEIISRSVTDYLDDNPVQWKW